MISGIAMVAAVVTAWIGFRMPGLPRAVALGATAAAAGTVAQVPLGAVTVAFDLNPYLVMSHFLLAMAVVAVAELGRPSTPSTRPTAAPVPSQCGHGRPCWAQPRCCCAWRW